VKVTQHILWRNIAVKGYLKQQLVGHVMAKYIVTYNTVATSSVEVDAPDSAAALEYADRERYASKVWETPNATTIYDIQGRESLTEFVV
jgi:hypothetical protein